MTREEKIKAIYEEMANKELTFGCKLQVIESVWPIQWVIFNVVSEGYKVLWDDRKITTETKNSDLTVIWHSVMIWDVLDRYRTNNNDYKVWEIDPYDLKSYSAFQEYDIKRLLNLWTGKRTLIDEQSDECIDYVYNLIQKD